MQEWEEQGGCNAQASILSLLLTMDVTSELEFLLKNNELTRTHPLLSCSCQDI